MGNLELEKCDPENNYQKWNIKQIKKVLPDLEAYKMKTSAMEELKDASDACSKAKDLTVMPAKDICAGKPR